MEKEPEADEDWLAECSDEELYNYRYDLVFILAFY